MAGVCGPLFPPEKFILDQALPYFTGILSAPEQLKTKIRTKVLLT